MRGAKSWWPGAESNRHKDFAPHARGEILVARGGIEPSTRGFSVQDTVILYPARVKNGNNFSEFCQSVALSPNLLPNLNGLSGAGQVE